jgi:hypothetical protein
MLLLTTTTCVVVQLPAPTHARKLMEASRASSISTHHYPRTGRSVLQVPAANKETGNSDSTNPGNSPCCGHSSSPPNPWHDLLAPRRCVCHRPLMRVYLFYRVCMQNYMVFYFSCFYVSVETWKMPYRHVPRTVNCKTLTVFFLLIIKAELSRSVFKKENGY